MRHACRQTDRVHGCRKAVLLKGPRLKVVPLY